MTGREPPPDLGDAATVPEITRYLRNLRSWAGHVSYAELARRVNGRRPQGAAPARQTTVYDCFRPDRKRLNAELVVDIAAALGLDDHRLVRLREAVAVALDQSETISVPAPAPLPALSAHFTGRARQLGMIEKGLARGVRVIAIVGQAGVGKTELALAVAHRVSQVRDRIAPDSSSTCVASTSTGHR